MFRNKRLDFLKGIAIIAVVLYHLGVMPDGYLGVDLFLVINGYLITKNLMRTFNERSFSYVAFLNKRISRLWPLVLISSFVCFVVALFTMLPDDLENLGQSLVASNLCLMNILSCVTTGNYWDVINEHKPLMHMWYVALIVQCYVIYPLLFIPVYRWAKNRQVVLYKLIVSLMIISLVLYILPWQDGPVKFYYLPYRFFEILLGALIAVRFHAFQKSKALIFIGRIAILSAIFIMLASGEYISIKSKVIFVTALSGLAILYAELLSDALVNNKIKLMFNGVSYLGLISFSLFVWHQPVFAFYKYIYDSDVAESILGSLLLVILVLLISIISYHQIENKIKKLHPSLFLLSFITISCGLFLYIKAGVVRDVPELEISKDVYHRGMHSEYTDRIYAMDRPFNGIAPIKVLVIGNSFGRDWINCLLESTFKDSLDISYVYANTYNQIDCKYISRIKEADVVFLLASIPLKTEGENMFWDNVRDTNRVFGIGTKSYGVTMGNVYSRRYQNDYYKYKAKVVPSVREVYLKEKNYWGDNYVDMLDPLIDNNWNISVFTPDKKYISMDCRHWKPAGAKYYSRLIDLKRFFEKD